MRLCQHFAFAVAAIVCSHSQSATTAEGKAGSLVDEKGHFYKPVQVKHPDHEIAICKVV